MPVAEPHPERARAADGSGAVLAALGARYRSLYALGRGGMGRVEVAVERAGGGRVVALKRLLPDAAGDPRLAEMFLREARLAALLSHPNVVHAFDYGEVEGELFLAMEYVEGEPLSRVLAVASERGARLPPSLAARVVAEICLGLHAAHELRDAAGAVLNVVHRDVSPHNVMVAYDGRIKLLDFGVAKTDEKAGLTRTGEVKGKVAYMSPEQAMGEVLDRRSDLYSIGAVLFECVTGRRMWLGTDMEVLRQLALDSPPRLQEYAPEAPPELCALHARLVARDPAARPATAEAVATELLTLAARDTQGSSMPLAGLMATLFAEAADERRARLARALEGDAAPASAASTTHEAVAVRDPPRRAASTWARAATGALVIAAAALGVRALARPRVGAPDVAPLAAPTTRAEGVAAQPVGTASATEVDASPSAPTPSAPARGTAASPARSTPPPARGGRPGSVTPRTAPRPAPQTPTTAPRIDVDPDPI